MDEETIGATKICYNSILREHDAVERKTKIVCTLGPACWDTDMLVKMLDAGMNVARLNFSHGDHDSHGRSLDNLRAAMKQRPEKTCAVMLDTKGPEIRTGVLKDHKPIEIKANQTLEIHTDYEMVGDNTRIACSYEGLCTTVKVGSSILIADGSLSCEVTEIHDNHVVVLCNNGCKIGERKNMNLPCAIIDLPVLQEKDEDDIIEFGLKRGVDMIAASFVRKREDLEYIRDVLGPKGSNIKIISKIENHEGLYNYDDILEESDGIMVARGDLGMELAPEKVFIAQKWMIEKANVAAKPVITATQMLESMINAPRPTRAEASDVANSVIDGTDCVMLSGESANGAYPVKAVEIMAKICVEAEKTIDYKENYKVLKKSTEIPLDTAEAVASAAVKTSLDGQQFDLIVVMTDSGKLARLVSKYRPEVRILACSINPGVVRFLNTMRGTTGLKIPTFQGANTVIQHVLEEAKNRGLAKIGSKVGVIHGTDEDTPDESNIFKVIEVE